MCRGPGANCPRGRGHAEEQKAWYTMQTAAEGSGSRGQGCWGGSCDEQGVILQELSEVQQSESSIANVVCWRMGLVALELTKGVDSGRGLTC